MPTSGPKSLIIIRKRLLSAPSQPFMAIQQLSMRKFNTKRLPNPMRMHSEPVERTENIRYSDKGRTKACRLDPLQTLHQSLIQKEELLMALRNSSTRNSSCFQNPQLKSHDRSLKEANNQIQQLKRKLSQQREKQEDKRNQKLGTLIDKLRDSLHNSKYASIPCPPQQQIMYPVPMPFPLPNYQHQTINHRKSSIRNDLTRESFRTTVRSDSFYLRNNKIRQRESKVERLKRNMKRWRKAVHAVLFTIYLRRFCDLMRSNRLLNFQKIKNSLRPNLNIVRDDITKLLVSFFTILLQKKEVSFEIEADEPKEIRQEKVASVRKLLVMALEAVRRWVQHASENPKFIEMLYHLCRHGNYCCTEPILTHEELQLSCMNPKHKYISADSNLEAAAFLNTVVIKVLVFNVLLKPGKDDTIISNLQIISSILYEMAIDVQDTYMLLVPQSYQIGNYDRASWVKSSDSLVYNRAPKQPGELISGLRGEEWVRKHFKTEKWEHQKRLFNSSIGVFQKMMTAFHKKIALNFF